MTLQPSQEKIHRVETLVADKPFEVEITGPRTASTAVIMVHGFGVRRDSRGLFTAIESAIGRAALCIRADYSEFDASGAKAIPFSLQVARLERVAAFATQTYSPRTLVYIGHSQGNLVIANARPKNAQVILIALPVGFEKFIETDGWKRSGSSLNLQGESRLARSDLAVTVEPAFWSEFSATDSAQLYATLARDSSIQVIRAGGDRDLGAQDVPGQIPTHTIANADHDFTGSARDVLVEQIARKLGTPVR